MSILASIAQPTLEELGLLAAAAALPAIVGAWAMVTLLRRTKPVPYAPRPADGKLEIETGADGKDEPDDFFKTTSFGLIEFITSIAVFLVLLVLVSSAALGTGGSGDGDANVATTNEPELVHGLTAQPEVFELEPGSTVVRQVAVTQKASIAITLRDIEPPAASDQIAVRLLDHPRDGETIAETSNATALRASDLSPGVYYVQVVDGRAAQTQPSETADAAPATFRLHAEVTGMQTLGFSLLAEGILKLLAIGIAAWLCFVRTKQNPLAILYRAPRVPELARGALILVAAAPILYVELPVLIQVVYALNDQTAPLQPIVETLRETRDPMLWGIAIFSVVVVAPIVEEFVFRGLLYTSVRRATNPIVATLASSLLFGLMHGVWSAIVVTAILGALLAVVFERSRSLVAPTIMHALFNGGSLIGLLLA